MTMRNTWPLSFLRHQVAGGGSAPYGSHAYWRFAPQSMNTDTYVGWEEIRLYDSSNVQIATTGQTYSEGGAGSQGAHGASAPFDGNSGTYWLRSGAPSYVQIQFSSPKAPARFEFQCEGVTRSVIDFKIQYSDDGSSWTDALTVWEPSHDATGSSRSWPQDFSGGKVKAVRWRVTANNGDTFAIMNEAEVHATVGGSDICNGGNTFCSTNSGTGTVPASLFDNNTSTHFDWTASTQLPGTIAYAFPDTVAKPAEYNLTQNNSTSRAWKDWKLQWSNDGVTWTDYDTQAGITWSSTPQTKTFAVP